MANRKFYMTAEQIEECKRQYLMNETGEINIAYKKPATGTATTQDMKQQLTNAQNQAPSSEVNLVVGKEDLQEKKTTKKKINEARLSSLKERSVKIKKKNLK